MQRFGPYGVQCLRDYSLFAGAGFNVFVYYRRDWHDEIIAGPFRAPTEAQGLRKAKEHIKYHKQQMEELRELTK